jgi:hypothetical protein
MFSTFGDFNLRSVLQSHETEHGYIKRHDVYSILCACLSQSLRLWSAASTLLSASTTTWPRTRTNELLSPCDSRLEVSQKPGPTVVSRFVTAPSSRQTESVVLFVLFHHTAFDRFAIMAYIHGIFTASWPWPADEASPRCSSAWSRHNHTRTEAVVVGVLDPGLWREDSTPVNPVRWREKVLWREDSSAVNWVLRSEDLAIVSSVPRSEV